MDSAEIVAKRSAKVIYRNGDKSVKVFDEAFSKADILNEALIQARVEETGLNIPKIIEIIKYKGKWAIVTEFIEGKTLETIMAENPDKQDYYLNLFVDLQMSVHAKRSPRLSMLKDKINRKISATELDATTRYDLHSKLEAMPKHVKVCHGDYDPSNVIIKNDGTPYIIDWAHATQGNASADAAISYLSFCICGKKAMAEEYLNIFCKKSDTAKQYIQKWLPIAAASQLLKYDGQAKEILLSYVNTVVIG
ncbi:MAG: phosphotransferase [Endomicrobium sp.]|jgi:tRNA A-37 threonylcarbamoyl transferase component Bud32|nr:phosphotransferase [Endomicrobium sp.]